MKQSKPSKKVVIITGATQGLGYSLVKWFCMHWSEQAVVYLTGRTLSSAKTATANLLHDGLHAIPAELDVSEPRSIAQFVDELQKEKLGVDILISNAAARITPDKSNAEQVDTFIRTNNLGTSRVLQAFTPLLRDNAHIIVVASSFGTLRTIRPELHKYFDIEKASMEDIDRVMLRYAKLVASGTDQAEGWPAWINPPSKIGQVATTRVYARIHESEFAKRGIRVHAACPGLMDTGASRPWFTDMSGAQTPEEAAIDVAWLATLPQTANLPNAELVQHRRVIPWL